MSDDIVEVDNVLKEYVSENNSSREDNNEGEKYMKRQI